MLNALGFAAHPSSLRLILPIGLSFYTFQSVGYVIDVSRGVVKPCRDPVAFLAYMCFFPQLLAGPIARAAEQLPQFLSSRRFDYALAVDGCRQMLWGFFKKFAVADSCAVVVNATFDKAVDPSGFALLLALVLYTAQIYCDFSGYSDLAIGCAKLFGIRLPRNFAFPYFVTNIADFWRRWHMSLMAWFKDYVYIPLGGSRVGRLRRIVNTYAVFLLSGLWHGASWTFVIWGAFHATCFLPRLLPRTSRRESPSSVVRSFLGWALTLLAVTVGWLVFRAPDVATLVDWLVRMSHLDLGSVTLAGSGVRTAVPPLVLVFLVEWMGRRGEHALQRLPMPRVARWVVYYALVFLTLYGMPSSGGDFIYGQF